MTNPKTLGYLPDIDGLRALAVLAVVLFHLEVPGFDGGYVGVDMFFVISGFLISGLLQSRIEAKQFSFSTFYANRVRRLLPSVVATVIGTSVASIFILQPQMLEAYANSAIASLVSIANIIFWLESGYWDANSDLKPLLHMWSLGVEEQFYLFWPALLLWLTRAGRRSYLIGLSVLFILSFAACIWYTTVDSAGAFYLLPFRVWQFCLGALAVEAWRQQNLSLFTQQLMRSTGLALCVFAVVTMGDASGFPGWIAIVPSVGAMLVLIACNRDEPSPWLANKPAKWFGQISYSLYLVHWPPIALYRCWTLAELTPEAQVAIGGLVLVLAAMLHYGVERRFYQRGGQRASGWHGVPLTTLLAVVLSIGVLVLVQQKPATFASRPVPLAPEVIQAYKDDRFKLVRKQCRIDRLFSDLRCTGDWQKPILFIGNSHEPDGFNILAAALPDEPRAHWIRFGSSNGCGDFKPQSDWATATTEDCQRRLDSLWESLDRIQWGAVIYNARRPMSASKAPFLSILRTIKARQPDTHIIIFDGYLATDQDCAAIINKAGTSLGCREPNRVEYFPESNPTDEPLRTDFISLASAYFSKTGLMCSTGELQSCPTQTPDGHPMFVDRHHLTLDFATWVGEELRAANPPWLDLLRVDDKLTQ